MAGKRGASRKKQQGIGCGTLLLYPLTAAGGVFFGVQAYNAYHGGPAPQRGASASQEERAPERSGRSGDRDDRRSRRVTERVELEPARAGKRAHTPAHRDEKPEASPPEHLADADLPAPAGVEAPAQPVPSPTRSAPPLGRPANLPADKEPSVSITPAPPVRPVVPPHTAQVPVPAPVHPVPAVEIERGVGHRREVALTFDAGSDWKPVKQILTALQESHVRSTFFLTGEWVQKNPRTTHLIAEAGHELGNHSWNHPPFTRLSDAEIRSQLRRTEGIIQETVGRSTHPYFRPPLGDRNSRVRGVVSSEGYFTVYWTLDSRDSVDKGITAQQIRDRVLSKVAPGSIVLMHCGSQPTAEALPEILKGLREKGLTPVTISRLLEE